MRPGWALLALLVAASSQLGPGRAQTYPTPQIISAEEEARLLDRVRSGARVYVEYAVGPEGPLCGIATNPEPYLARHERIVTTEAMAEEPWSLPAGTLLDEHCSYALRVIDLPEGSRVLATYGRYLGTYRAFEPSAAFVVTMDLGEPTALTGFRQVYGAGRPDYYPEGIELSVSGDGEAFYSIMRRDGPFAAPTVHLTFPPVVARYARVECTKWKRSPTTDFLFVGEMEWLGPSGATVATGRPYHLAPSPPEGPYGDGVGKLTDGVAEGLYTDGLSVGWTVPEAFESWPALIEAPIGDGLLLYACTPLSDAERRRFRPSAAWQAVADGIARTLDPGTPVPPRRPRMRPRIRLTAEERPAAYRAALDRNMDWFLRSGIMPDPSGREGVHSTLSMAALFGGQHEDLPSSYRLDCNAMTAKAFALYAEVSGDDSYLGRARAIADRLIGYQFGDPTRPSYGGYPWLDHGADVIYFWDDNTRIAEALLWLHGLTGEPRYLESALANLELCRDVARDDGVIAHHVVSRDRLDAIGRQALRDEASAGLAVHFDALRWGMASAATGAPEYADLGRRVLTRYGAACGAWGLPYGAVLMPEDHAWREDLAAWWDAYTTHPVTREIGVRPLVGPGDYRYAFHNDCSINTEAGEPLTDQLYSTSWDALNAWAAHKATGDPRYRAAFEGIADYLVAIQCTDPDPRLDGCWMRGFDYEAWEYFGAPYDPNYGPYHAYSGWMNAIISTALAQYLLDAPPWPPAS